MNSSAREIIFGTEKQVTVLRGPLLVIIGMVLSEDRGLFDIIEMLTEEPVE